MCVTQVNDGFWIREFQLNQNVLDLDGIVAVLLVLDDFLNGSELTALGGSFNVLFVDLLVIGRVDDCAQEEENTFERSNRFEHLDDVAGAELSKILD
jgi:hypothetical protein